MRRQQPSIASAGQFVLLLTAACGPAVHQGATETPGVETSLTARHVSETGQLVNGIYVGDFHHYSDGKDGNYPCLVELKTDAQYQVRGTLYWLTNSASIITLRGASNQLVRFSEGEIIKSGDVQLGGEYVAQVKSLDVLEGHWLKPGDRKDGGSFTLRSLERVKAACDQGAAADCRRLAQVYQSGYGVARDQVAAGNYLLKACLGGDKSLCQALVMSMDRSCTQGHAPACGLAGQIYEAGKLTHQDLPKAIQLLQKGCKGHDGNSCLRLGSLYQQGKGLAKDPQRALSLFIASCSHDDATGCALAGQIYLAGDGVARAAGVAAPLLKKACDGAQADSCHKLAGLYLRGDGIPQDAAQAASLLQRACDEQDARACLDLSNLYQNGTGVGRDEQRAYGLIGKACEQDETVRKSVIEMMQRECRKGASATCYLVGALYAKGAWGIKKDAATAVIHFQLACRGDDVNGCTKLGQMYREGDGVSKDRAEAFRLFTKSCLNKDGEACAFAAIMISQGEAYASDARSARALVEKGCEYGYEPACGALHHR